MDRLATRFVLGMLGLLGLGQLCAGCQPDPVVAKSVPSPPVRRAMHHTVVVPHVQVTVAPPRASLDVPDTCDRLIRVDTDRGPVVRKRRPGWLGSKVSREAHQAETRRIIEIVGDEMGADALATEYLVRKGIYESSGNEAALHITDPDVAANRSAARKGRRASSDRWASARVPIHDRDGKVVGDYDAWALGRGLYGMVTGLYLQRWSTDAPPWALCDPVIATVTAIWAIRAGLEECHGSTLRDANRRFSSGRCALRDPEQERKFDRLARGHVRGLKLPPMDPDAPADFGSRWPELTTDRGVLLARIRSRLAE